MPARKLVKGRKLSLPGFLPFALPDIRSHIRSFPYTGLARSAVTQPGTDIESASHDSDKREHEP